jgi:hypothetical protein
MDFDQNGPVESVSTFPPIAAPKVPLMFGPNITGVVDDVTAAALEDNASASGVFNVERTYYSAAWEGSVRIPREFELSFSAQRGSALFSGSSTVQPSSMRLLPCIKF